MLIYNSLGSIDETALNNLSLTVELVKKIRMSKDDSAEEIEDLAK